MAIDRSAPTRFGLDPFAPIYSAVGSQSNRGFGEVNGRNQIEMNGKSAVASSIREDPKIQTVGVGRYPLVERRSYREASSVADIPEAEAIDTHPGTGEGATGAGSISRGESITPEPRRFVSSPGAIGDGRRMTATPPSVRISDNDSVSTEHDGQSSQSISLAPTPSSYLDQSFITSVLLDDSIAIPKQPPRSSSPIPTEPLSSSPIDALSLRLTSLESTVSTLSSLVTTEVRTLQEEVGVLRGLLLRSATFTATSPSTPQQPLPSSHRDRDQFSNDRERDRDIAGSPLLVLRSPSPTFSNSSFANPSRPAHQINAQPTFLGLPASASLNASHTDQRLSNEERARLVSLDKDEQIRSLTAQLSSISASVAHLIGTSAMPSSQPRRLPVISPAISPSIGSIGDSGWKREANSPVMGMGSIGSPSLGGQARVTPTLRPSSSGGLSRNGSLGGGNNFATFPRDGGASGDRRSMLSYVTAGSDASSNRREVAAFDSPATSGGDGAGLVTASSSLPALASASIGSNSPGSLGGKWEALGVGADLFRTIVKYGLGPPTKIQTKAIPCVLTHQDVVAQAPSIQERIQSYIVPALQMIYSAANQASLDATNQLGSKGIQVLIVTATVDQAAQAQRLSVGLGGSLGIRTSLCVGHGDLQQELSTLVKSPPHVLVGTPQRLLDLFAMRSLSTSDVRLLVIDECDQLIARNLSEFIVSLVRMLPPSGIGMVNASPTMSRSPMIGGGGSPLPGAFETSHHTAVERSTAIYSCTVPQDVLNFASSLQLREPVRVLVRREGGDGTSPLVRGLKQYFVYIAVGANSNTKAGGGSGRREAASSAREWKLEALADLVEDIDFSTCVIFCSSVDAVEAVSYKLGSRAIEALALHQDMGQAARHSIMSKFRSTTPNTRTGGSKRCLVVYDALCRTLSDVHTVPLVINYDLPRSPEDYVHRIACATATTYGRPPGIAINIVTPGADVDMLRSIESFYRCKIAEFPSS